MTSPSFSAIRTSNDFMARRGNSAARPRPHSHHEAWSLCPKRAICGAALLLVGRGPKFVSRITAIFRADEGQHFPKIVGVLDDGAEGRHGTDDVFMTLAHVPLLLKFVAAQGHESKQRVVIAAVDPGVVGERRAHAA